MSLSLSLSHSLTLDVPCEYHFQVVIFSCLCDVAVSAARELQDEYDSRLVMSPIQYIQQE